MILLRRLLVAAFFLGLLLWWTDVRGALDLLVRMPIEVTLLGVGLGLLRTALMSLRWCVLDRAVQSGRQRSDASPSTRLGLWDYFRYLLANGTAALFLPSAVGADAARAVLVTAEVSDDRPRRVVVIFFDRLLGLASVCAIGLVAVGLAPALPQRGVYFAALAAMNLLLIGSVLLSRWGRVKSRLFRLLASWGSLEAIAGQVLDAIEDCTALFRDRPAPVVIALLLCLVIHLTSFALVQLAAVFVGVDIPFAAVAIATTLSWIVVLLPISVGGLGVRELSFVALLAPLGVGAVEATAISLFQFVVIAAVGILGIPAVVLGRRPAAPVS